MLKPNIRVCERIVKRGSLNPHRGLKDMFLGRNDQRGTWSPLSRFPDYYDFTVLQYVYFNIRSLTNKNDTATRNCIAKIFIV